MASHRAYLPLVSSPVARKRYTSPTTAMVRPSPGFLKVGRCVTVICQSLWSRMFVSYSCADAIERESNGACVCDRPGNPRRLERRHVAEDVGGRGDQGERQDVAPVPSPRRRPRSSSGPRPRSSRTTRWPGSGPRWAATSEPRTFGQSRAAIRPAVLLIRPSRTTSDRRAAAPTARPGQAEDLEPADPREPVPGRRPSGAWRARAARDRGGLAAIARVVHAGPPADDRRGRGPGQGRDQGRRRSSCCRSPSRPARRRGIPRAGPSARPGRGRPEGAKRLLAGHRRAVQEVRRAPAGSACVK